MVAHFARRYGAYELNQCKLKMRAYDMRPCEISLIQLKNQATVYTTGILYNDC